MGRYNNRRTQAAAAALKNTPSRARFSKGPPNKNKGRPKRNNRQNDSNGDSGTNNANTRGQNAKTQEKVVGRLQQRVNNRETLPARKATSEEALQFLDKSKLDYLKLPDKVLQNISNLLENLGVKEQGSKSDSTKSPVVSVDDDEILGEAYESTSEGPDDQSQDDSDAYGDNLDSMPLHPRQYGTSTVSGYTEYDDDMDESFQVPVRALNHNEIDWEDDGSLEGGEGATDEANEDEPLVDAEDSDKEQELFREDPAFVYLSQRLSFPASDALRACRAIQDWSAVQQPANDQDSSDVPQSTAMGREESIALAMDWLCLHLTESQLTAGFRPNPNPPTDEKPNTLSKNGVPLVGTIKAVPHPSISLAQDATSGKAWARSCRLQERTLKFVRYGFSIAEATQACEATESSDEEQDMRLTKLDPLDDPGLLWLMNFLCNGNAIPASEDGEDDLDSAEEERGMEKEALEAIYDDQLEVKHVPSFTNIVEKYVLHVSPAEELQLPAISNDCRLHVFVPRRYPTNANALFLFSNPSLPPSLLRSVNTECNRISCENIGLPVVFEVVTYLTENLPEMQLSFIREQRRKEFDAEQNRLRKEAGLPLEQTIEAQYETDGKIGRRQRARLKAAEKAFDRPEQLQQQEQQRLQKQEERIARVKSENSRIRAVRADAAIKKRQDDQILEMAEKLARAAMNKAFNTNATVEEARAAAEDARSEFLRANDYEPINSSEAVRSSIDTDAKVRTKHQPQATEKTKDFLGRIRSKIGNEEQSPSPDEHDEETEEDNSIEDGEDVQEKREATATTAAFMERLRSMYDRAAKKKDGFQLADATEISTNEKDVKDHIHMPCPVAADTGELNEVMTAIVEQQEEQPWLVAPEARVPSRGDGASQEPASSDDLQRQHKLNKALKEELVRKRKLAREWGEKNDPQDAKKAMSKGGKGFSAAKFHSMMNVRQNLPAFKLASSVVQTIEENQITVIAGDTGCGKTTQVPQLVLDDRILRGRGAATNIIVTQPRRISAIGVSERIASERCEKVGETCGYSIKLERRTSSKTRLLLCTTGVLLRRLQCDPDLASVSHIFVDEVHERDLNTDFLIIILKDLLARRSNLKLVLMSATLNSDAFSSYFFNCPTVFIPGRAHPVKEYRLEDVLEMTKYEVQEGSDYALEVEDSKPPKFSKSALRRRYYPKYSKGTIHSLSIVDETIINYELIAALLEHIVLNESNGAILVFLPGMMEITKAIEELYKSELFQSDKVRIYPLHSSLSTAEQTAIFEIPPEGVRKIVVSTNIAETSITIEDVVFVIDAGKMKENRRDEINETPTLVECWVSRAAAKQRRGRAGRVQPGTAYHLFSSHTHDAELQDYQLPEMLRVGIEDLVLQVLILDLGDPVAFLGKALNPPSDLAMSNSLKLLETLGAVECQWTKSHKSSQQEVGNTEKSSGALRVTSELTALGFHLATLPVDPRVGKLMIYGSLLGCVDPALTIAASMSSRSPFISPFDQREAADEARKTFATEGSDHLTILNAFNQWQDLKQRNTGKKGVNSFLKENFLGRLTLHQMEDLRKQFAKLLKDIGFLPKTFNLRNPGNAAENQNAGNIGLVKAVLCAGLYPNILLGPRSLVAQPGLSNRKSGSDKKAGECTFRSQRQGEVHLHPSTIAFDQSSLDSRYCCYHEMVKTSKIYARDTTTVSPFALLLFGGTLKVYQRHSVCSIDDWLKFRIDAKPATLVKYLRGQLEKFLLQKIINPQDEIVDSDEGKALIDSINLLFKNNEVIESSVPDRSAADIVRPWTEDRANEAGGRGRGRRPNSRAGGRGRGRGGGRQRNR